MFVLVLVCIVGPFVIIGASALTMAHEEAPSSPTDDASTEGNDMSLEDSWPIHPQQDVFATTP